MKTQLSTIKRVVLPTITHYYINDVEVSQQEYKNHIWKENRKKYNERHPLFKQITALHKKHKKNINIDEYKALLTDQEKYDYLRLIDIDIQDQKIQDKINKLTLKKEQLRV